MISQNYLNLSSHSLAIILLQKYAMNPHAHAYQMTLHCLSTKYTAEFYGLIHAMLLFKHLDSLYTKRAMLFWNFSVVSCKKVRVFTSGAVKFGDYFIMQTLLKALEHPF